MLPRAVIVVLLGLALRVPGASADTCVCGQRCDDDTFSDDCNDCPAGQYTALGGGVGSCETPESCKNCPKGKYSATSRSCSCVSCPVKQTTPLSGATSDATCTAAPPSAPVAAVFTKQDNTYGTNVDKLTNGGECLGDCDQDAECGGGLQCTQRAASEAVPGCAGTPLTYYDYCSPSCAAGKVHGFLQITTGTCSNPIGTLEACIAAAASLGITSTDQRAMWDYSFPHVRQIITPGHAHTVCMYFTHPPPLISPNALLLANC